MNKRCERCDKVTDNISNNGRCARCQVKLDEQRADFEAQKKFNPPGFNQPYNI